MAERRDLTVRIRIPGRTSEDEDKILVAIRRLLEGVEGAERPSLEISRASAETIEVVTPE